MQGRLALSPLLAGVGVFGAAHDSGFLVAVNNLRLFSGDGETDVAAEAAVAGLMEVTEEVQDIAPLCDENTIPPGCTDFAANDSGELVSSGAPADWR